MVEVDIGGKKFPLCLTVSALDKVNEKCGGMKNIGAFLDGKDTDERASSSRAMVNTVWMLALLLQEGEENRIVFSRLAGEETERQLVPDQETLNHLLTVASANKYRVAVIQAVNESMVQEIEALYPKNVKDAEQE